MNTAASDFIKRENDMSQSSNLAINPHHQAIVSGGG